MYSGLVLSIFAITTASQQIIALQRLDCYERGPQLIRNLLSLNHESKDGQAAKIPLIASYHWQVPVMLQGQSLYLFLLGMLMFAYHEYGIVSFFTIVSVGKTDE